MKRLFLDDIRVPINCYVYIKPTLSIYRENWEIVRSYREFIGWIKHNGLPDIISFDHDLGDSTELRSTLPVEDWYNLLSDREYTGMDCALYLVRYCMRNNLSLPEFIVHSQNPVGKENIEALLNNFKKSRKMEEELRTSKEWWEETKSNSTKLIDWLKNQYHGEALASERIRQFILPHFEGKYAFLVERIADDEQKHAAWVGKLLLDRGIMPEILDKEERYWKEVMVDDFNSNGNYAAAVAAHAEEMRLERIKVIMEDSECPTDIRSTFIDIYKDELFHAKGFKLIAGDEYYTKASEKHARGVEALGLIV